MRLARFAARALLRPAMDAIGDRTGYVLNDAMVARGTACARVRQFDAGMIGYTLM